MKCPHHWTITLRVSSARFATLRAASESLSLAASNCANERKPLHLSIYRVRGQR